MELRHIRYFLAVAEERNFTRAARRLGIGQPPLSQQIRDLEGQVGAALFRRLPQGAELTEAGRAFLEQVQAMPAQAERAVHAARRAARGEVGALRVGFTGSAAFNPAVPAAIRAFRRAWPEVELSLEETNTGHLVAALVEGELDAAFIRPGAGARAALQLRMMPDEPLVAVLPASHPLAARTQVALADLKDEPFVVFPRAVGSTLHDTILEACRVAGFEPIVGQIAPQMNSVVNLVAAELGVALTPASMRQVQVEGVVYRPLAGAPVIAPLALACRRGETSPLVRNFLGLVS